MKSKTGIWRERSATIIMGSLKGFGPKQSRNLLQALGLTRYEIPIDSRITKWLNHFGFPIKLSAAALADPNYYNFVLDGFQKLCEAADIYPCVMDAAIFASSDTDWPKINWCGNSKEFHRKERVGWEMKVGELLLYVLLTIVGIILGLIFIKGFWKLVLGAMALVLFVLALLMRREINEWLNNFGKWVFSLIKGVF